MKLLMQPAFAAIRLDKGFHLQSGVRTRRARELRLRGLSIRRDVGPKDRTCGALRSCTGDVLAIKKMRID